MGFWSATGKTANLFVNVRVDKWIGAESLRDGFSTISKTTKSLLIPETPETKETFEEAQDRLEITDFDLHVTYKKYFRFFLFFTIMGFLIIAYSIHTIFNHNFTGFVICLALSVFSFSQAFKFHFWCYQIKRKKLGCTVKDWLDSNGLK